MSNHKTEQAVIYRIYTEDREDNRTELYKLVNGYTYGFTIISSVGFWRGTREACTIIEIIGEYSDKSWVLRLAGDIKILNKQESVLVTTTTGLVNEIN